MSKRRSNTDKLLQAKIALEVEFGDRLTNITDQFNKDVELEYRLENPTAEDETKIFQIYADADQPKGIAVDVGLN